MYGVAGAAAAAPVPQQEGLGVTAPHPPRVQVFHDRASLFASVAQACQLANGKAIGRAPFRGGILALGNGFF
jgi:hypothetical protein